LDTNTSWAATDCYLAPDMGRVHTLSYLISVSFVGVKKTLFSFYLQELSCLLEYTEAVASLEFAKAKVACSALPLNLVQTVALLALFAAQHHSPSYGEFGLIDFINRYL
jgi:hypothetical protein